MVFTSAQASRCCAMRSGARPTWPSLTPTSYQLARRHSSADMVAHALRMRTLHAMASRFNTSDTMIPPWLTPAQQLPFGVEHCARPLSLIVGEHYFDFHRPAIARTRDAYQRHVFVVEIGSEVCLFGLVRDVASADFGK